MKWFIKLYFLPALFIFFIIISGCTDLMGGNGIIYAERVFQEPQNYINLTQEEIEIYPHLIEAINNTNHHIETPSKEWYALKYFFGDSHKYILYQDKYYYVRLFGIT